MLLLLLLCILPVGEKSLEENVTVTTSGSFIVTHLKAWVSLLCGSGYEDTYRDTDTVSLSASFWIQFKYFNINYTFINLRGDPYTVQRVTESRDDV